MIYRAIQVKDDQTSVKHFDTITDAYKYFLPPTDIQARYSWHVKLLWPILEEFKSNPDCECQLIAWNDVKNPEEESQYKLYVQKLVHVDSPILINNL